MVNIAFTASLWQVWRSTFCSSSTLPKALLAPRPPSAYFFLKLLLNQFDNFCLKVLRTSLTNPQQDHKGCLVAVSPTPPQHLRQLPNILRKPWPNTLILFKLARNSPMQTVSLMSGISQPIPAHLVLMSSLQSLGMKWAIFQTDLSSVFSIVFTQSSGQASLSPSPPLCCHH